MNTAIAQSNMVKQQLRTGAVLNKNILGLYQALPRDSFVPRKYKQFAYSDYQIPLVNRQKMLTPLEEATILQALDLKGCEIVLEVGSGSGYFTALLSRVAKQVVSVECDPELAKQAQQNFDKYQIDNVSLYVGDGHRGWLDAAPYDAIVVTGSIPQVDDIFKPQLMKHGKMFAIIGSLPVMQGTLLTLDNSDQWHKRVLFDTVVEPLSTPLKESDFNF